MNREQTDNMVSISFLNPLSPEGKDIVRELGSFGGINQDIPELRSIVTHNPSQEIVDDNEIPSNYLELALKRMEWYIKKKMIENSMPADTPFYLIQPLQNMMLSLFTSSARL
ncbi:hypothetical protein [Methanobacterium ferruginis]|uniref:hypothetical protein n=1 Tax=Methanobacterium ferruginis TaxID=710191 RepID=UPI002574154B|nr:hypothetical protein [Methanobacterium ferruginis]BDZ68539.1 hypothetical protein GCM10025860_19870 [Methanobacterium ferruginis]